MPDGQYWRPEVETLPWERVRARQAEKLPAQLAYVAARSPFYREKWAEAGVDPASVRSLEALARLPFTTKDELRRSQAAQPPLGRHAAASLDQVVRVHASSGTTGRPVYVAITASDRAGWTEIVSRCLWTQGLRPESRLMVGFSMGIFVGGLALHDAVTNVGAAFIPIGTGASDRLLDTIQWFQCDALTCTPSYALYLAEYARERVGLDPRTLGIRRILCGAEPGGGVPSVRDRISAEWDALCTESLGSADVTGVYAAQCDQLAGNHYCAQEYAAFEIIHPDTGAVLPLSDGAQGEIVFTHLQREAVPLVRYRTGDQVIVWTEPCACGRSAPRLRCVGRTDDMLIVAGVNVFPSAIRDVVGQLRPATTGEIQVVLQAPGPAVPPPLPVRVEYGDEASDLAALKKTVEERIKAKLIVPAAVELVPRGALPRFEMKAQLIKKLFE